ncbi:MAG: hypothetical protein H0T78_01040 [Longispora sp.]|nr:hypothetical protein [Longispora sp. (in: high G+C Gram-positive bacteria)]
MNDPAHIAEAEIYFTNGGLDGSPEGQTSTMTIVDSALTDPVPNLNVPAAVSAWDVWASLAKDDGSEDEAYAVFGTYFVTPDPVRVGEWRSYLEVDLKHPDNAESASRLKAELAQ